MMFTEVLGGLVNAWATVRKPSGCLVGALSKGMTVLVLTRVASQRRRRECRKQKETKSGACRTMLVLSRLRRHRRAVSASRMGNHWPTGDDRLAGHTELSLENGLALQQQAAQKERLLRRN